MSVAAASFLLAVACLAFLALAVACLLVFGLLVATALILIRQQTQAIKALEQSAAATPSASASASTLSASTMKAADHEIPVEHFSGNETASSSGCSEDWSTDSASVFSSLNDTDFILGDESYDSDENVPISLGCESFISDIEIDGDMDVDASACSSLNDTDFILGGESYDSDEDVDVSACSSLNDTDFILGGESYDSDEDVDVSACSSLNDTDYLLGGESYDSDDDSELDSSSLCASKSEDEETSPSTPVATTQEPALKTDTAVYRRECNAPTVQTGFVGHVRGSRPSQTIHTAACFRRVHCAGVSALNRAFLAPNGETTIVNDRVARAIQRGFVCAARG